MTVVDVAPDGLDDVPAGGRVPPIARKRLKGAMVGFGLFMWVMSGAMGGVKGATVAAVVSVRGQNRVDTNRQLRRREGLWRVPTDSGNSRQIAQNLAIGPVVTASCDRNATPGKTHELIAALVVDQDIHGNVLYPMTG